MSRQPNDPRNAASEADDADFVDLLRGAMQCRPEPFAPSNLAAQAMLLARAQQRAQLEQRAARLARQRRWAQITGLAATLLIGALLYVAVHRIYSNGDIAALGAAASSDSTSTTTSTDTDTSTTTASSDSSTTYSTGTITALCVGGLVIMGIVLLTLPRSGPTTPWGAEALAGVW